MEVIQGHLEFESTMQNEVRKLSALPQTGQRRASGLRSGTDTGNGTVSLDDRSDDLLPRPTM